MGKFSHAIGRRRTRLVTCAIVASIGGATPVFAQVLSPGKLARPHAPYEGLSQCTLCHSMGKKIDGQLCLDCHKDLAAAAGNAATFHGRLKAQGRACTDCHKDHRGEEALLAEWPGRREAFDHGQTGWPLSGKHAKAACGDCHQSKDVNNAELKKRLSDRPLGTYLGVGTACTTCHFDEHRGQVGTECLRCHDQNSFQRAPGFVHDAAYRLLGAHRKVTCDQCHPQKADAAQHNDYPLPLRAPSYAVYKAVGDRGCLSCHKDVHGGKFGGQCESCHGFDSWQDTHITTGSMAFHDKSRFPLKGLHQKVACDHCHPHLATGGIQRTGFPFKRCNDCHLDAHLGQIAKDREGVVSCEKCHDENGFFPTLFTLADHDKTTYPLAGAHVSVPCNRCHRPEMPASPADAAKIREPIVRTQLVNRTRLTWPKTDLQRCDSCHNDPHAGQFATAGTKKACTTCHTVQTFAALTFAHNRDSRFVLTGKHVAAPCARCHPQRAAPDGAIVVYRGLTSQCASCHVDPHLGQFDSSKEHGKDCDSCHDTVTYKPATFTHDNPQLTAFALTGKHAGLPCAKCHPQKTIDGRPVAWYRGVPERCDGCHVDVHAGPMQRSRP